MKANHGFTLVELTISTAVLAIVSLISFSVIQATSSASAVASAKDDVQRGLRGVLDQMAREVASASKKTNIALTPQLAPLTVNNGTEIVFQVPLDTGGTQYSNPITYRFESGDVSQYLGKAGTDQGNQKDVGNHYGKNGKTASGDPLIVHRIMRVENDAASVLGATDDIKAVTFALNAQQDTLTITVTAAKTVKIGTREDEVSATDSTSVYLAN